MKKYWSASSSAVDKEIENTNVEAFNLLDVIIYHHNI